MDDSYWHGYLEALKKAERILFIKREEALDRENDQDYSISTFDAIDECLNIIKGLQVGNDQ